MASLFTGTTSTQTNVPGAQGVEKQIQELTLSQLLRQQGLEDLYDPIIKSYIQNLRDEETVRSGGTLSDAAKQKKYADMIAREEGQAASADRLSAIQSELAELSLADAKRGGKATPEQAALIDEATAGAQAAGEADIGRFTTSTLRQINEEIASASGMRPTDTPVVRLSERAGEEAARQQGILTSNLRTANANAKLNFPLAASSLTNAIAGSQGNLATAAQQLQTTLSQRAQDNRFRLFASNPTSTFGINPTSALSTLTGARVAGASTDKTISPSGLEIGSKLAQGIGSVVSVFSDRRLKREIYRVGALPSGIPLYVFKYHGFEDWHMGVMADEVLDFVPEAVTEHESGFLKVRYDMLQ